MIEYKHTRIEAFVGIMQPLDVVIRQVEVERLLDIFVGNINSFISLTQTREVPCPVDRQAYRTQRECIVVHVWMKLVRSRYACTLHTVKYVTY